MIENVKPTDKFVCDLNLLQIDYNEQKKESLRHQISKKYGIPVKNVEIRFKPIKMRDDTGEISLTSNVISSIQDPKFHVELFKEYLKLKDIKDIDINDIIEIDNEVNSFVDFELYSKYKSYKVKYLKWDNFLSYGEGNYLDFTNYNGLTLVSGFPQNQSGKTTFSIEILRFALFGKSSKVPTLDSAFNSFLPEATNVVVEVGIEIDGVDYVIRRTITRPSLKRRTAKSKCTQTVEYFQIINGTLTDLKDVVSENNAQSKKGETNRDTNNIIKDAIGEPEDYDLIISATSRTLGNLLDLGQADRGRLFSRWLGLATLEEKDGVAKDLWKNRISKTLKSNMFNKTSLEDEIKSYKTVIEDNDKIITKSESEKNNTDAKINKLNADKLEILSKKKEVKEELIKLDVNTIEASINKLEEDRKLKNAQMDALRETYIKYRDVVYDQTIRDEKVKELSDKNVKVGELRAELVHYKNDNKRIEDLINKGVCPTCNHKIELLEQNKFIEENNKKIEEITNNGIRLNEEIQKINKEISDMDIEKGKLDERNKAELTGTALKAEVQTINLQINDLTNKLAEVEKNKANIELNNSIDNDIRLVDVNINTENDVKEGLIRTIQSLTTENENSVKEIKNREEIIEVLNKEEKIIKNWSIYKEMVGSNGVVKIVLKKALPIINTEVKRILNGLVDFDVMLDLTEDNKVKMNLIKDGVELDLGLGASGLEGTMSSLALRSALASVSSLPKPNLLVLDEILGQVAKTNYDNVHELYNRISTTVDTVLHITHDEDTYDWHDGGHIIVVKEDNISKLVEKE